MRDKILIVDDVEINREILAEILREEYEILMAEKGLQTLDIPEKLHEEIVARFGHSSGISKFGKWRTY